MPRFVAPLQDEIMRLARKEVSKNQKSLKRASVSLRKENSELRKRLRSLEKTVGVLQKAVGCGKKSKAIPSDEEVKTARLSPKSIIRMREKHDLSRVKMAELLGFNHMSLARWEQGKGRPRNELKKKLLAFKLLSKREVKKLLKGPQTPAVKK